MKKRFLSLALALAVCLSLTIPALAENATPFTVTDSSYSFKSLSNSPDSGEGWSYDGKVLTLNGYNGPEIYCEYTPSGSCDIVLAAGSKNTAATLDLVKDSEGRAMKASIRGSGELVIDYGSEYGPSPFHCNIPLTLNDGLVMTGGLSAADRFSLTLDKDGYPVTPKGDYAQYIRIAPAAGAGSSKPNSSAGTGFTDVPANSPYAEAIKWAVEQGITNGTSATTFSPNQTCTTGQILTFLWRAAGKPSVSGPYTTDAQKAMAWGWQDLKIGEGVRAEFDCTRVAAMNYIWDAAGQPKPTTTASFSDLDSIGKTAVSWAVEKGITNGTSATTFSPYNTCTRGQIVTFLYRASK